MKNFNAIIIFIILCGSLWSLFYYNSRIKSSRDLISALQEDLLTHNYFQRLSKYTILDESTSLDSLKVMYIQQTISSSPFVNLSDVLKSPTLVFRISDDHCSDCLHATIKVLNEKFNSNPLLKLNTVILADFSTISGLNAWVETNQFDLPLFYLTSKQNVLFSDNEMKPYLFIFTPEGKVSSLHIPVKENMEFTSHYISFLESKFF